MSLRIPSAEVAGIETKRIINAEVEDQSSMIARGIFEKSANGKDYFGFKGPILPEIKKELKSKGYTVGYGNGGAVFVNWEVPSE